MKQLAMLFAVFLLDRPSCMILVVAVEVVPCYVLGLILGLSLHSSGRLQQQG
jgi:hypothetical protein